MSAAVVEVLDALRAHLTQHPLLPEVYSVQLGVGQRVKVQVGSDTQAVLAGRLVAWAGSLSGGVTVQVWRTHDGQYAHLYVAGQLAGGVPVTVFGGMSFAPDGLGAGLGPGERRVVTLAALRSAAAGSGAGAS